FNVAVHEDDEEARPGGTRRYIPPDLDLAGTLTRDEEIDRDLYALGVSIYECVTGKYPWTEPVPPPKIAPRDPTAHVSDLAPEFAQILLRAIAPRRADRFASASEFRTALATIARVRSATLPVVEIEPKTETQRSVFGLQPHKPNFNPFVSHLLTMYSQSL